MNTQTTEVDVSVPLAMHAWLATGHHRLEPTELAVPTPQSGELLVRVLACAVCRTDLHVVKAEIPRRKAVVVPGHQIVGEVVAVGERAEGWNVGDRVGVPWLRSTCGTCHWCTTGAENLCPRSTYTGWDADGGFAEYAIAPAAYSYRLPRNCDPVTTAPLLCGGIIGYRALKRAAMPPAGRLGIYGFGASAQLTIQVARARGDEVHVVTPGEDAREHAIALGAKTAGGQGHRIPPLDAAIIFAPAGEVVPQALAEVGPGGTVAVAGIHMSPIPPLDYDMHLFHEKTLTSVTSNTREDGVEFLRMAERLQLAPAVTTYPLARVLEALEDLDAGNVHGVAVLTVHED